MKRLFAVLLVIALVIPGAAYAADPGWSITYSGTVKTDRNTYFAVISGENCFGGEKALHVKWQGGVTAGENVLIKNTFEHAMPRGNYTLKFMNRGDLSKFTQIAVGDKTFTKTDLTAGAAVTAPDGSTNWKEYSVTFDYSGENADFLSIMVCGGTISQFIDDVSLVNNADGTDYIADGGFENFAEADVPEAPYDRSGYAVRQLRATTKNANALVISWINPAVTELSEIKIYDISGGKNELIAENISTAPGKSVFYEVSELATGQTYQYKVIFSFGSKGSDTYFVYGTPSTSTSSKKGSWNLGTVQNGTAAFCPAGLSIDTSEAKEGSASLKFETNIDGESVPALKSNIYAVATQSADMMNGKYQISFWMKQKNMLAKPRATMNFKLFDGNQLFLNTPGEDWTYYEFLYDYDANGENTLTFTYDRICDGLWIDDVQVRKYNTETGTPEGDNLISDGSFENLVSETAGVVTGITAVPGVGSVTVSDYNVTGSYSRTDIYQKVFDNFEYRGSIAADVSSFGITGLKKDEDVTFRLVPVNVDGISGTSGDVTVRTVLPEYEVGDAVLYDSLNRKVNTISDIGTYTVKISLKNNLIAGGLPYDGMAALYKDGALIKVFSKNGSVRKTGKNANAAELTIPVEIQESGNYTLEFYLIDSRASLKHYCRAYTWKTE